MAPTRIAVRSHAGKYSIVCGTGALKRAGKEIAALGKFSSVHIITSPKVWRAVAKLVPSDLVAEKSAIHLMSDAETHKDMHNVETLCRSLVRGGADRKSLVIAIGGGVTGDVAGFAAASYLRGVALVHVPTTLVSQVDSSIGGKTGVNLPDGKNLVGAFYPPRLILTDPSVLCSLPDREFRGGLAEVIKHAIIADAKMFGYIERNIGKILKRDAAALEYLIPRNAAIKAYVVSKDEKESGLREILNFGHTFAHALESTTKYTRFQHGEAVAWGMMAAALLAHETKVCDAAYVSRIVALVRQIGPFPAWPNIQPNTLIDAMRSDKKTHHGKLRFVLSPRLGKAGSYDDTSLDAVRKVLRFAPQFVTKTNVLDAAAGNA
ncbi:MAG TPA: 3-dehydroquinate synthase [Candidatus Acidoferrum sp.]|jgi:3-dehydroquinate synthase